MSDFLVFDRDEIERLRDDLAKNLEPGKRRRFKKLFSAALGGVPWVGGLMTGLATLRDAERQAEVNELQRQWLETHAEKLLALGQVLADVTARLDEFGDEVRDRIESEEYLAIVRLAFRAWDQADSQEKRDLLRKLLANAGAANLTGDDIVKMFIQWIDRYNEIHFKVIRVIYQFPGSSRAEIWDDIHGVEVREDSAEADLFKLLIRDLSTGGVIRQVRKTDDQGRFLRKRTRTRQISPYTMSAFDGDKPYVLTALGQQFVHYVMDEVVPRIG
ncbi:hypothetical protein V3331_13320 [Gaopeijia maritima]|uniref:hypothetical protein n=1 Tax=Gaopeijia maritima TaxID=3119007 RepID=UPI00324C9EDF